MQIVRLLGILPNMLELTVNACTQGCEYCYAKNWKKEYKTVSQVINKILREEKKEVGLMPFLIRQRSPITISNRSDLLCLPNYKEYIKELKALGFRLYIETKGNKDIEGLLRVIDKNDYVYFSFTGKSNKFEEKNILSWREKIGFIKSLQANEIPVCVAVNPYHPDKTSVSEIKDIIDELQPYHFVMRPYHRNTMSMYKKYESIKEQDESEAKKDLFEIIKYCHEKRIKYDINWQEWQGLQDENLNVCIDCNNRMFGGNSIVVQRLIYDLKKDFDIHPECDGIEVEFSYIKKFFKKEIKSFDKAVITKYCYSGRYFDFSGLPKYFKFEDLLKIVWNYDAGFKMIMNWWTDMKDIDGNKIYYKERF